MKPRCAVCGRPYHRYSTSDPQHKWDGVACVNGLLHEIEAYRETLEFYADDKGKWIADRGNLARQVLSRFEVDA